MRSRLLSFGAVAVAVVVLCLGGWLLLRPSAGSAPVPAPITVPAQDGTGTTSEAPRTPAEPTSGAPSSAPSSAPEPAPVPPPAPEPTDVVAPPPVPDDDDDDDGDDPDDDDDGGDDGDD